MKFLERHKPFKTIIAMAIADILANLIVIGTIRTAFEWQYILRDPLPNLNSIGGQMMTFAAIGAVVWLLAGIPVHLVKMTYNEPGLWGYVWPAGIAGTILGAAYIPLFLITAPAGLLIGIFNAVIFWLIRRPDQDNKFDAIA